jgi:hypothetical protein
VSYHKGISGVVGCKADINSWSSLGCGSTVGYDHWYFATLYSVVWVCEVFVVEFIHSEIDVQGCVPVAAASGVRDTAVWIDIRLFRLVSFVLTRVDHCNAILAGRPNYQTPVRRRHGGSSDLVLASL